MKRFAFFNKKYLIAVIFVAFFAVYFIFSGLFNVEISFHQPEDIGDVVVMKFGPFANETSTKTAFSITPEIEGELIWHENKKELHFIPKEGFAPDQKYTVKTGSGFGLLASLQASSEAFTFSSVSFNSSNPVNTGYIEQNRYIDINLSTMTLTLIEDGKAVRSYPVAGKGNPWTKPTREGTFTIKTKEPNHLSSLYNVWMPWSMQYSGDYFIHEWPYYPGGRRITSKYSSGCIRLHQGDAKEVFDWAEIGTTVVVHSTKDRLPVFAPEAIRDGDLVREKSSSDVYIIKFADAKKFKRHAWTPDFGIWYQHLNPFWKNVKIVADGSLDSYLESRWVSPELPQSRPEARYIYELDLDKKIRHTIVCGETPLSSVVKPEFCKYSWTSHGWPIGEVYTISEDEFNVYAQGEDIVLQPSASAVNN